MKRWIGNRTLITLAILLTTITASGYFFLTAYRPPLMQYVLAAMAVIFLDFLAWKFHRKWERRRTKTSRV